MPQNMAVECIELRYEDLAAGHQKFYRAYVYTGGSVTQWGRLGTVGQFQRHPTPGAARTKVQEKEGKGYQVSVNWFTFQAPTVMVQNGDAHGLYKLANQTIGKRVSATPKAPPAKSDKEVVDEFTQQLLAMRAKYRPSGPGEAPEAPQEPTVDPDSVEGRLGAALAAARSRAS